MDSAATVLGLDFEAGAVVAGAGLEGAGVDGTTHSSVTVMVVGPVAVIAVGAHLWSLQVVMVTVVAAGQ